MGPKHFTFSLLEQLIIFYLESSLEYIYIYIYIYSSTAISSSLHAIQSSELNYLELSFKYVKEKKIEYRE